MLLEKLKLMKNNTLYVIWLLVAVIIILLVGFITYLATVTPTIPTTEVYQNIPIEEILQNKE